MDAEDRRFGDKAFDAVTNAYGLMFCPDPQRAINEAYRVLKPGGRLALATWANLRRRGREFRSVREWYGHCAYV